jgi:hypothetical protein
MSFDSILRALLAHIERPLDGETLFYLPMQKVERRCNPL